MSDNKRTVFGYAAPSLDDLKKTPAKQEPSQTTQADGASTIFDENPYGQQHAGAVHAATPTAESTPQPGPPMGGQGAPPGAAQSQPMPQAQEPQQPYGQAPQQAQGVPPQQQPQGFSPHQSHGYAAAHAPNHSAPNMQAMAQPQKDNRKMILLIGGAVAVVLVVVAASLG